MTPNKALQRTGDHRGRPVLAIDCALARAIEAYRKLVPKSGVMSQDEADTWAAALRRDSEEGVFFSSSNYYAYVARRP